MCNNFKNRFLNPMSDECFSYFYTYRKIRLYNCPEMARIRVKICYTSTIYLVACAKAFRYLKKYSEKENKSCYTIYSNTYRVKEKK